MSKLDVVTKSDLTSSDFMERSVRASSENPNVTQQTQHRRHNSLTGRQCSKTIAKSSSITDLTSTPCRHYNPIPLSHDTGNYTTDCLRTATHHQDELDSGDEARRRKLPGLCSILNTTKDQQTSPSYDETDHLQYRLSRNLSQNTNNNIKSSNLTSSALNTSTRSLFNYNQSFNNHSSIVENTLVASDVGNCTSGMSSGFSSPSPSTVSSPLSTPRRPSPTCYNHSDHQPHNFPDNQKQQLTCCQKSCTSPLPTKLAVTFLKDSCAKNITPNSLPHQHYSSHPRKHNIHNHHYNNSNHPHKNIAPSASTKPSGNGSKNLKHFDPRLSPSSYRQLLPIALCLLSFATVFSILIVYMDTTEIRHQQFRLNMSRDDDYFSVSQDDPKLIAFLREIHMSKYPMHFLKTHEQASDQMLPSNAGVPGGDSSLNFTAHPNELTPKMAHYVAQLSQSKNNGAVIQSMTGSLGQLLTAPWLSETLNWAGTIVEPEPRRFFTMRKQNALRPHMQVLHACVSPQPYPKEVTIHNEESEVRINSLLDEETSWFNSRVKCFPLYTIMLASNRVEYDLLSLGVHGHELEILQTLPFENVKIEIISIHLLENQEDVTAYVASITKFLKGKSYRLLKKFGRNYFYRRMGPYNRSPALSVSSDSTATLRTRKKDILLLKTP